MSSVEEQFRTIWMVLAMLLLVFAAGGTFAAVKEAPTVSNSIIVLFKAATLPADASQRIQQAGGKVVRALNDVGIVIATPGSANAAALIQNLLKDSAVLDADSDLIAPALAATESYPVTPDDHFPHPSRSRQNPQTCFTLTPHRCGP
jgi:hypothetical protein